MVPGAIIKQLSFMVIEMAAKPISILVVSPLYKEANCITEIQRKLY